tara:strand:+ start:190 stop:537 length:348 start_codon:yes stop_codon:yes gene_type:complete
MSDLKTIQQKLKNFAKERDWEQFHSPKNLSMALSVEAAELMELLQWSNSGGLEEINDPDTRAQVEKEIADIFNYILRIADVLDMDLEQVALQKISENELKYPVEKFKGIAKKYNK